MFFDKFWNSLYPEWHQIDIIQNDNKRQDKLEAFYKKYKDQFVDDYAVTDPNEDFAETWAFFLLSPNLRALLSRIRNFCTCINIRNLPNCEERFAELCRAQP